MRTHRLVLVVGSFALAVISTGCITSRSADCLGYTLRLPDGKEKKSIAYSFIRSGNVSSDKEFDAFSSTPAFSGAYVGAQTEAAALSQFRSVFEPVAKLITPSVDRNGGDCDIMLAIHQQNAWNPFVVIPAFINGLTFLCIPCWADDVYYLNVIASNKQGLKKEYLIKRKISTTTWLPFIVATPFTGLPITAMEKITLENWKELRCKMEDDGFFDAPKVVEEIKKRDTEYVQQQGDLLKKKDEKNEQRREKDEDQQERKQEKEPEDQCLEAENHFVLEKVENKFLRGKVYKCDGYSLEIPPPNGFREASESVRNWYDNGRGKYGGTSKGRLVLFEHQNPLDSSSRHIDVFSRCVDVLSVTLWDNPEEFFDETKYQKLKNKMFSNASTAAKYLPPTVKFDKCKDGGHWFMTSLIGMNMQLKANILTGNFLVKNHLYQFNGQARFKTEKDRLEFVELIMSWLDEITSTCP